MDRNTVFARTLAGSSELELPRQLKTHVEAEMLEAFDGTSPLEVVAGHLSSWEIVKAISTRLLELGLIEEAGSKMSGSNR